MSATILDPLTDVLVINDFPIEDFPPDGNAAELNPQGGLSTYTPSFGMDLFVLGVMHHQLVVNVQSGSPSDNWLEASAQAFRTLRKLWSLSWTSNGKPVVSSVSAGPITLPPIIKSVATQPIRSWVIAFKTQTVPRAGQFTPGVPLTKAEVQGFQ